MFMFANRKEIAKNNEKGSATAAVTETVFYFFLCVRPVMPFCLVNDDVNHDL